jgi:hypothetical protein
LRLNPLSAGFSSISRTLSTFFFKLSRNSLMASSSFV